MCVACEMHLAAEYGPDPLGPCPKCGTEMSVWYPVGKEFRLRVAGFQDRSIPRGRSRRHWEYQSEAGHSVYEQDGRVYWIEREIDRVANEYYERIVDKETGEVVREVHEPLTAHRGHGSARRVRKPPPSEGAA